MTGLALNRLRRATALAGLTGGEPAVSSWKPRPAASRAKLAAAVPMTRRLRTATLRRRALSLACAKLFGSSPSDMAGSSARSLWPG